jgi:uncharacterized SAM-binding protein YcdF (DUF218 family)
MYFIFSKILLFMLDPFFWVAALFIIALFRKKPGSKKRFFISSAVVFIIFSNPLLFNYFARVWNISTHTLNGNTNYSCAIVLGGFSSCDRDGNGYFNQAADRFIQGVKLKTTGRVSHVLISGGSGLLTDQKFREAAWVQGQLKQFNLPDSSILIEPNSRNTFENAEFSKKLLQNNNLKPPYVLVTGEFHMRRALAIFKKEGIDVIPYTSEHFAGNAPFSIGQLIPDPEIITEWKAYTKEVVGRLVVYFK